MHIIDLKAELLHCKPMIHYFQEFFSFRVLSKASFLCHLFYYCMINLKQRHFFNRREGGYSLTLCVKSHIILPLPLKDH